MYLNFFKYNLLRRVDKIWEGTGLKVKCWRKAECFMCLIRLHSSDIDRRTLLLDCSRNLYIFPLHGYSDKALHKGRMKLAD